MTTKTCDPTVLRAGMTVIHHHPAWNEPKSLVLTKRFDLLGNGDGWLTNDSDAAVIDRYVRSHGVTIVSDSSQDEEPIKVGDWFRRVLDDGYPHSFRQGEVYEVVCRAGLDEDVCWKVKRLNSGKIVPNPASLCEPTRWARVALPGSTPAKPEAADSKTVEETLLSKIEHLKTRDDYFAEMTYINNRKIERLRQELDQLKTRLAGLAVRHESLVNDLKRSLSENE